MPVTGTGRELDGSTAALDAFVRIFQIAPAGERGPDQLEAVARAFACMPYENLSKIIQHDEDPGRRRGPCDVLSGHAARGTGGTCFSLTATLLSILRALGWRCEPLLADRHYGENTHSAVLVWVDGAPHLIDPGYLITRPVPIGQEQTSRLVTSFNEVILQPDDRGRVELFTSVAGGGTTKRLTFHREPADAGEFLRAWDASFDWDMMRYPLLTQVRDGRHLYLQGQRLQSRQHADVARAEVELDRLPECIAREFGVDVHVVRRALDILRDKGELDVSP